MLALDRLTTVSRDRAVDWFEQYHNDAVHSKDAVTGSQLYLNIFLRPADNYQSDGIARYVIAFDTLASIADTAIELHHAGFKPIRPSDI